MSQRGQLADLQLVHIVSVTWETHCTFDHMGCKGIRANDGTNQALRIWIWMCSFIHNQDVYEEQQDERPA